MMKRGHGQLHDITWGTLDHAFRAPYVTRVCVCVCVCVTDCVCVRGVKAVITKTIIIGGTLASGN